MTVLETQFKPYVQFQFDGRKNKVGAEILMRCDRFRIEDAIKRLSLANELYKLDFSAFKYALDLAETSNLQVSSNFCARSLAQRGVVQRIMEEDPLSIVTLEITETGKLCGKASENINYLSKLGFKISLDDFGSGQNGFNRVIELPLAELKIDRFVIKNLAQSKAKVVAESTIELCSKLGYRCVAEGIEHRWQYESLVGMGCDRFQGFYFHKPEPLLNQESKSILN